ncbi:MAG: glycosyltransferase family 39 protein [Myxococcota bacterium]|nr:glycosyltransferase family 39 protein [Myxococcota bacterium]
MRIFRALVVAVSVFYVGSFIYVSFGRLTFPFDLEWMEGGMLMHAVRLSEGRHIYAPPSTEFVPFFYTPGYAYVVSFLSGLTGDVSFVLGRSVSLCSTLVTFGLLYWIVRRESTWLYAVLSVGLYAALFRTNGAFYDLARPDAMCMCLILMGTALAYYARRLRWIAFAGVIMAAAFLTKQTASVFIPAIALYLWFRDRMSAAFFLGAAAGIAIGACAVLNMQTDGWFWTYIFEGHQGHAFIWENILLEYWRDLLFLCPVVLLVPLLWFSYRVPIVGLTIGLAAHWAYAYYARATTLDYVPHMYYRELFYENPRWLILIPPAAMAALCLVYRFRFRSQQHFTTSWYWLIMYIAGVGASGLNHSTQWAYSNCFMLMSVFAAILVPLALRDLNGAPNGQCGPRASLLAAVVLVAFTALGYRPAAQVPTRGDFEGLTRLKRLTDDLPRPLLMPAHPFYSYERDQTLHLHQMGVGDVAYRGGIKDLESHLRRHAWGAVVLDERLRLPGLERGYFPAYQIHYGARTDLLPKTGFMVRPSMVWLPQTFTERMLSHGVSGNFEDGMATGWTSQGRATPNLFRVTKGQRIGQQGEYSLQPTKKGVGRVASSSIQVEGARLSMLVGASHARALIRVRQGRSVVARLAPPVSRTGRMARRSIDLSSYQGQQVQVELVDRTEQGGLKIDDLRWVAF